MLMVVVQIWMYRIPSRRSSHIVNNLISTHIQINASNLLNTPSTPLNFLRCPSLIKAPCLIDRELLQKVGISKKEQNHSIHLVSCLINKALYI